MKSGGVPGGGRAPLLIYDGGCGFCTRAVRLAVRLDQGSRVRFRPFQELPPPELRSLGLSPEDCERRLRFVVPGGRTWGGALAVNRFLLCVNPGGFGGWLLRAAALLVFLLPPLLLFEVLAYEMVARNRHRFGSPDCGASPPLRG